jgi:tetratricopeptide (TPR) repeat protein
MVVKNKDEGTELFKGGNYRPAAARYHKALTHAAKFFDLSPEDEVEVKGIRATIYLNLTSCYIKMENWDQAMRNVNDALAIDDKNPKAYFRRATVYEAKKDWEKALTDIKKCQELSDVEDKVVTKKAEQIKKEIQKEKEKEKKMWGKAFSK